MIKEIRKAEGLTQQQFAHRFGIPLGTLRNWEQGISSPPEYVYHMIMTILERDYNKMIDLNTIKFQKMLDTLAALSEEGFDDFTNATNQNLHSKIFYNLKRVDEEGNYFVVASACIIDDPECYHHDIMSYYDSDAEEYTVRVVINDENDNIPFILIKFLDNDDQIIIENGEWYFT